MNFKKLREKSGVSQAKLASAIGCDERTIRNWESGFTQPNKAEKKFLVEFLQEVKNV